VAEFAPCEDHRIQQFLDLRVARLGVRQDLADVVDRPLYRQGVPSSVRSTTITALTTWVVAAT
jgi:hypothetical protein